jgi:tRNA G46 methylase TrmB
MSNNKVEFGDFQTPLALARQVCSLLVAQGVEADCVVEPTCGLGAFLVAAAEAFPTARLLGWDINGGHVHRAESALAQAGALKRATLRREDFFAHDWDA